MARILIFLILIFLANPSFACKPSKSFTAPFLNLVKSSSIVSIGEISDLVQYYDRYGNGTQIATVKVLKDVRGNGFPIFRIASSVDLDPKKKSACNLYLDLKIGEKYLFTPNFTSPNAFEKIASVEAGADLFRRVEAMSLNESIRQLILTEKVSSRALRVL